MLPQWSEEELLGLSWKTRDFCPPALSAEQWLVVRAAASTFQVTQSCWNFAFFDCVMKPSKLCGFVLMDAEGKSEKGIIGTGD